MTPQARFVQFQDKGPELAGHLAGHGKDSGSALLQSENVAAPGKHFLDMADNSSKQFQHLGRRESLKLPARVKCFKNSKVSFFRNCETEVEQVATG